MSIIKYFRVEIEFEEKFYRTRALRKSAVSANIKGLYIRHSEQR